MVTNGPQANDHWYAHEWTHWLIAAGLVCLSAILTLALGGNWMEAALFILTGALAGYLTNDIAVTLLLWPTEPRLGGVLHGVFFKRREEFGAKLIDEACNKFLNPELFRSLLQDKAVEGYVRNTVTATVEDLAGTELGSFRSVLARIVTDSDQREQMFDKLSAAAGNHLADQALAHANEENVSALLETALEHAAKIPLDSLREHRKEIEDGVSSLWGGWFSDAGATRVKDRIRNGLRRALASQKTIGEVIPKEARDSLESHLMNYVSERFRNEVTALVKDKGFRDKVVPVIVEEIGRIVRLKLERPAGFKGWLIKTFGARDIEDALQKLAEETDRFLAEKVPELMSQPEMTEYAKGLVSRALNGLWNTRVSTVGKAFSDDALGGLCDAAVRTLGSAHVRSQAAKAVTDWLCDPTLSSVGEIFPGLSGSSSGRNTLVQLITRYVITAVSDDGNRKSLRMESRIIVRRVIVGLIDSPLPRLAELPFFKPRGLESLAAHAAHVTVGKLRDLAPDLVTHFPIRDKLNELWSSMSNEQIRVAVDGVLAKEFKVLINLGVSFGAVVGTLSFFLQCLGGPVTAAVLWILPAAAFKAFKWAITTPRP